MTQDPGGAKKKFQGLISSEVLAGVPPPRLFFFLKKKTGSSVLLCLPGVVLDIREGQTRPPQTDIFLGRGGDPSPPSLIFVSQEQGSTRTSVQDSADVGGGSIGTREHTLEELQKATPAGCVVRNPTSC